MPQTRQGRVHRSVILAAALWLLIGITINIVVAQFQTERHDKWTNSPWYAIGYGSTAQEVWPHAPPPGWPIKPTSVQIERDVGWTHTTSKSWVDGSGYYGSRLELGLPMRSMFGWSLSQTPATPENCWRGGVITTPLFERWFGVRRIVWYPMFPGFLVDSLLFTGIGAWMVYMPRLMRALKASRMRRLGRCPHCCYDLKGLEFGLRCPECGKLDEHAANADGTPKASRARVSARAAQVSSAAAVIAMLFICLLIGAITNFGVAWGRALVIQRQLETTSLFNDRVVKPTTMVPMKWPYPPPAYWPSKPDAVKVSSDFGWTVVWTTESSYGRSMLNPTNYSALRTEFGWPLRTVVMWSLAEDYVYSQGKSTAKYYAAGGYIDTKTLGKWVRATRVPWAPEWFGLVVNTLFYAAVFGMIWLTLRTVRRWFVRRRRRRRGQCPKCGADIRNLAPGLPCPDCGRVETQRATESHGESQISNLKANSENRI